MQTFLPYPDLKLWEGRAFLGGHVSKSRQNIILTTTALKQHLGLPFSAEEQLTEEAYRRGSRVEAE